VGLDAPRLRAALSEALEISPQREKVKHVAKHEEPDSDQGRGRFDFVSLLVFSYAFSR
jgi:hypothetical protein